MCTLVEATFCTMLACFVALMNLYQTHAVFVGTVVVRLEHRQVETHLNSLVIL